MSSWHPRVALPDKHYEPSGDEEQAPTHESRRLPVRALGQLGSTGSFGSEPAHRKCSLILIRHLNRVVASEAGTPEREGVLLCVKPIFDAWTR